MAQHYDIIGDIHGCHQTLVSLLERLGYIQQGGHYQHPSRKVIFVGDFIDRGPMQLETVQTVRAMVDAKQAYAVMGNHEFNAIAFLNEQFGSKQVDVNRKTLNTVDQVSMYPRSFCIDRLER